MAKSNRFKSGGNSVFGRVIGEAIEDAPKILNAIDFIDSPQGFNFKLYPLQRLIVKCVFAVPIDYKPIMVPMWDIFREKKLREVTEEECLHILYSEGRCNIADWRDIPQRGFNEATLYAGRRGGKMLHVDEVIPTPSGFIRNGDLKDGDEIFGEDGNIYQVAYAHPIEEREAYKVTFDDGTSVYANGEHLWLTFSEEERREYNPTTTLGKVSTTSEIKATLTAEVRSNPAVKIALPVNTPEINLPLDPYSLGTWLGEGVSPEFTPLLKSMGLLQKKYIPEAYLWASLDQRLALLQGLMDSGGDCGEDDAVEFCHTSKNLAEGVYHLASSLGFKPYLTEGEGGGFTYRVTWTGSLKVFRLPQKQAGMKPQFSDPQNWRYIQSIEPEGKMRMRCITTTNPSGLYLFGKNFNVTHNSELTACIGGYKLYKMLNVRSPQEYFGLKSGSPIDFTFMAQDDEGSGRLFTKLREGVNNAPFFTPYIKASSASSLGFVSEADRHKRDVTPTINVASYACTSNASRGPSNVFLALDEFAFFRGAKGSSSDEVYSAAVPSTANFKHAELLNGEWVDQRVAQETFDPSTYKMYQDSLVVSISSPWTKVGKMYDLHRLALDKGVSSGIFTIRVATSEMNPSILPEFLRNQYSINPLTFKAEYGGQFLESSETYLTEDQIKACTDVTYKPTPSGVEVADESTARLNLSRFHSSAIGRQYFWAIDLGMVNDGTAVAISHLEFKGGAQPIHLVYDYIDRMMVGEKFTPNLQNLPVMEGKYVGYKALPLEDILAWFKALNEIMPCFKGATDQHGGQQLIQLLDLNKIHNIELVNLTDTLNSQMAYVLQGYVRDQRCHFPYAPKFLKELRLLEAEYINKYKIRVQAPLEKGSHDDLSDAVMLNAYIAQEWLMNEGGLRLDPTGQTLLMNERMNQPTGIITNLEGVSMREMQIHERMRKMQSNMGIMGGASYPLRRRR